MKAIGNANQACHGRYRFRWAVYVIRKNKNKKKNVRLGGEL